MIDQLQQVEVLSFDEAVEALDSFRNIEHRKPARILFNFPVSALPAGLLNEYRTEAKELGLFVNFAA